MLSRLLVFFNLVLGGCTLVSANECGLSESVRQKLGVEVRGDNLTLRQASVWYAAEVKGVENETLESQWIDFEREARRNGCIVILSTPQDDWENLRGYQGLGVIRDMDLVFLLITTRN